MIDQYIADLRNKHKIIVYSENGELKIKAPKESLTKEIIDELRSKKGNILDFINNLDNNSCYNAIPISLEKNQYALSPAQKRLYFLYEYNKESLAYNLPQTIKLEGALNYEKLKSTFNKLIDRHKSLCTYFELRDEEPVQKILKRLEVKIEHYKAQEEEVSIIITNFIRPFDLNIAPLFRVGLIELSEFKHLLMVDMHHIITDGTSQGIMIKDFMALYNNEELSPLRLQYKDYSEWLQTGGQQKQILKQKKFWLNEFAEEVEKLELPTDFPRPAIKKFDGNTVSFKLGVNQTNNLKALADKEGATLFMALLAISNILLAKLSNKEDIVIGTPIAGRQHADLEQMIGMFVNTLPLRNQPRGELSFKEFLAEVKSKTLTCFNNQGYQYEALISDLNLQRDTSRNPLFDFMFVFQNFETNELKIPGLKLEPYNTEQTISKFDITLSAMESDERILFYFQYSTALFKKETVERFIGYFNKIVSAVVTDSEIKISEIDLLSKNEKQKILFEFNDTKSYYPKEKNIVNIFEKQVEKSPHSTALICQDKRLSFKELDEKSNQLAWMLLEKGVNSNEVIGVLISRRPEMIISILAILKTGCPYLPIDPDYPIERVNYVLKDSGARLILTEPSFDMVYKQFSQNMVSIDVTSNEIFKGKKEKLNQVILPTDLAYLIYTSGSTGNPKGVMIEHRNVINFIQGVIDRIEINEKHTFLCLTTISFDIFVLESILPLLNGNRIVLVDSIEKRDPLALAEKIVCHDIDILQITPSHLKMLFNELSYEMFKKVKIMMIGGEALPDSLLFELKKIYKGKIYNMYGPTETTVWSTIKDLTKDVSINIGKPINNTSIYILDKNKRVLPMGVSGELCIGGAGLARGYWGNNRLTNEKFIDNPYCVNERLYKTGDLARWLPDGNIEFLGRIDNQVKIRGFRIELGEIESKISEIGAIKDCVVLAKDDTNGNKRLVAYIVVENKINVQEIRERLSKSMPDYMIPALFISLKQMPLTPNGKIDKKALPKPEGNIETTREYVAPRNNTEQELANIWGKILGVEKVGVYDNFFELGGNSMSLVILSNTIKVSMNCLLSLEELMATPILYDQVVKIESFLGGKQNSFDDEANLELAQLPIPPRIKEMMDNNEDDIISHYTVSALFDIELEIVDLGLLSEALRILVKQHDALQVRVFRENDELNLAYGPIDENYDIQKIDLTNIKFGSEQLLLKNICDKLLSSLVFSKESSLFKTFLLDFGHNSTTKLFFVFHHWFIDSTGLSTLLSDLLVIYRSLKTKKLIQLAKPACSLFDFASALKKYAETEGEKEAAYWLLQPWSKISSFPEDDDVSVKKLIEFTYPKISKLDATLMDKIWNNQLLTENDYKQRISGEVTTSVLSKELTMKLISFERNQSGIKILDVVLLAMYRALQDWTNEEVYLMNVYKSGRVAKVLDANLNGTVFESNFLCPIFIQESNKENPIDSVRAIQDLRNNIPNEGATYLAVKYYLQNKDLKKRVSSFQIPQVDINYFPFIGKYNVNPDKKEIEPGISACKPPENLITNHPKAFDPARLYFQIGFDNPENNLSCHCAIRGFDFIDNYFKSYYHPARAVYLPMKFIEHISNIITDINENF